eukprot:582269-Pelagomonas_calceolata.AAC.1
MSQENDWVDMRGNCEKKHFQHCTHPSGQNFCMSHCSNLPRPRFVQTLLLLHCNNLTQRMLWEKYFAVFSFLQNASMTYFFDAKVKLDVRDDEMKEGPQRYAMTGCKWCLAILYCSCYVRNRRLLQGNEPATKAQLDDVESKVRELRGLFGLYGLFGIFGVFGTLYEMKRKMTGYGEASPRV